MKGKKLAKVHSCTESLNAELQSMREKFESLEGDLVKKDGVIKKLSKDVTELYLNN